MRLKAIKPLRYDTRRLLPGDTFDASAPHGRLLVAIKKAVPVPERNSAPLEPPPRDLVTAAERAALDAMRKEAGELGIPIDRRWGLKRLAAEIETARTAKPGAVQV